MGKITGYALSILTSVSLSCATPRNIELERAQVSLQRNSQLEMSRFRRQGLELEEAISGANGSARIWTTIDARVLMENKKSIVREVSFAFQDVSGYFNSFLETRVRNIDIVIDEDPEYIAYSFSNTNIIVLNEDSLELMLANDEMHKKEVTLMHEYAHIQNRLYDYDEPLPYNEMSAILLESMYYIHRYGYDDYNNKYMQLWDWYWFRPEHILNESETSHTAIRLVVKQFVCDAFEGRISWEDNNEPLEKLKEFARAYFNEQANRSVGFDNAAESIGLEHNGNVLRLNDIREEAYANFINGDY